MAWKLLVTKTVAVEEGDDQLHFFVPCEEFASLVDAAEVEGDGHPEDVGAVKAALKLLGDRMPHARICGSSAGADHGFGISVDGSD